MHINNEFFSLILFIDEASFTDYGLANLHNMLVGWESVLKEVDCLKKSW